MEEEDRKSPPGKQGCVSVSLASSQNTIKRQKRWETPIPYRAGGDQSWGRENTAPDSAFLFFPSTFQASQARTNEAEQGWEASANLTCSNQEESPKAAQPQKSRGDGEGDETPSQTSPHQAQRLSFPPQMQKHLVAFGPAETPHRQTAGITTSQRNTEKKHWKHPQTLSGSRVGTTGTPTLSPPSLCSLSLNLGHAEKGWNCGVLPPG